MRMLHMLSMIIAIPLMKNYFFNWFACALCMIIGLSFRCLHKLELHTPFEHIHCDMWYRSLLTVCWSVMESRPRPRPHHSRPRPSPRPDHSRPWPPLPRPRPLKSETKTETETQYFSCRIFVYTKNIIFSLGIFFFERQDRDETETHKIRSRDGSWDETRSWDPHHCCVSIRTIQFNFCE